jgi:DedD protein
MDEGAKRRLVGAAVVVALIIIFVPMLVDESDPDGLGEPIVIPDEPSFDPGSDASDELEPLTAEDFSPPLPAPEPPGGVAAPPSPVPAASPEQPPVAPPAAPPAASDASSESLAPAGPKPVPPGATSWVIQVASLGSPDAARALQDQLRGQGFTAFVERATVSGKQYYRVRVGPEVERTTADRLAAKLRGITGNEPLVQRYP